MPRCACCEIASAASARSRRWRGAEVVPARWTRRTLLARAGALAVGGAALAGCENTTTPVAVSGAGGGKGLLGDTSAGGPVDASGIPLVRRDYPVTLLTFMDP